MENEITWERSDRPINRVGEACNDLLHRPDGHSAGRPLVRSAEGGERARSGSAPRVGRGVEGQFGNNAVRVDSLALMNYLSEETSNVLFGGRCRRRRRRRCCCCRRRRCIRPETSAHRVPSGWLMIIDASTSGVAVGASMTATVKVGGRFTHANEKCKAVWRTRSRRRRQRQQLERGCCRCGSGCST